MQRSPLVHVRPGAITAALTVATVGIALVAVPSSALTPTRAASTAAPEARPASAGKGGDSRTMETVGGTVVATTDDGRFTRAEQAEGPAPASSAISHPVGFLALDVDKLKKGAETSLGLQLPVATDGLLACTPQACTAVDSTLSGGVRSLLVADGGPLDGDGAADGDVALLLAPTQTVETGPSCALPAGEHVVHTWSGTVPVSVASSGQSVTDTFALPEGCAVSAVTARIAWDLFAEDLDLEVTDAAGTAVVSEQANAVTRSATEQVELAPLAGTYTSVVSGYLSAGAPFTGDVVAVITGDAGEQPGDGGGDGGGETPPPADVPSDPTAARVVVADLDSAINPYHDAFYAGGLYYPDSAPSAVTQEVLAELGVAPENVVRLTRTGDFAADFAADKAFWDSVQPQTPYHFLGTNIVATSFAPEDTPGGYLQPDPGKSAHGVGTASSVLAANPDAVLYFVEQDTNLGSDESHAHAFLHPAVDIVTTSYGVSVPRTGFPIPEANAFASTYDGVVEQGKLHFSSGGNGPGITPLRAGAGPWWSIGVSGVEEGSSNGQTTLAGRFPDFVSDFRQQIPYCHACESGTRLVGGTSFSTPRAAGVASRVLLEARRAAGHVGGIATVDGVPAMVGSTTNWQLRRALEQAAHVPGTSDYDPIEAVFDLGALPVNDAAPYAQVGWGDLTADPAKDVVPAALRALGGEDLGKDAGFCDFQTAIITTRQVYWNEVAPFVPPLTGEQVPGAPAQDPFVYC